MSARVPLPQLIAMLPILTPALLCQGPPSRLADIHSGANLGPPFTATGRPAALLGNRLLVPGNDTTNGSELWATDGTAAGTGLVRDIAPGPRSSSPADLTVFNGLVYFSAEDGARGRELWRTDGTVAGTVLFKDIDPDGGSDPLGLAVVGGVLYFHADDGTAGRELWKSDGTAAGTVMVEDIWPGASGSMDLGAAIVSGRRVIASIPFTVAVFAANDGVAGRELWESRGTAATTLMRADINPGAGNSSPTGLTAFSGHVMFAAEDGTSGVEPYHMRDGSPSRVTDLNPGSASSNPARFVPVVVGGGPRFFFAATNATYGREVFFWDTALGAGDLLRDFTPGIAGSSPDLMAVGGMVLIAADNPSVGRELWRTDSTLAGAQLLKDIRAGAAGSSVSLGGVISDAPPRALLGANDGIHGPETWVTDGTVAGTVMLLDVNPDNTATTPSVLGRLPSAEILCSTQYLGVVSTPLVTDGTPAGTQVLPAPAGSTHSSQPGGFVTLGTSVLFAAEAAATGRELWRTDGTGAGTSLVKDIAPRAGDSAPAGLVTALGLCFFTADDGTTGREPWVSDGTAAGTRLLRDVNPGSPDSNPGNFAEAGGIVYFWASDGSRGVELWRTNGTTAGTTMVVDLEPGSASGIYTAANLLRVGNRVMFWSGANAAAGLEPWISNGTAAGTTLLKDLDPGSGSSMLLSFGEGLAVGDVTYFRASTAATGVELWRTNGTAAGTTLVMDLLAGTNSSMPRSFCSWGGQVCFLADGPGPTTVLWGTFGTAGTTAQVRSLPKPPGGLLPSDSMVALTPTTDRLWFAGWDATHGFEPWTSNGTFGGTAMVADLTPGPVSSLPLLFDPLGTLRPEAWFFSLPGAARVLFRASSGPDGVELWHSDGTAAGTARHADLLPGAAGSRPQEPILLGTGLLFAATDPVAGAELFAMASMGFSEPFGVGCQGSSGRIPGIAGQGAPFVGNAAYGVRVTSARPSSSAILIAGFGLLNAPIGGGCTLYVDFTIPPLVLAAATSASGIGVIGLPIPADPSLVGLQLWAQVDVVDPGAAFQGLLAMTGGLHIVVGPN